MLQNNMVKITQEMLLKHASHSKKRSNETDIQYLKRLTHIYFQEKNIDEIDGLSICKSLSVLYLYDNNIQLIKNLDFAASLTHLYLQKNKISRISGLKRLSLLTKLYLGHNSITVVEGLENNGNLTELHIESQYLPTGEKLLFDPRTMDVLSRSLSVLNISGNNLDETSDLRVLRRLNHLMIEDNELEDWAELSETLFQWKALNKLEISGNPICHHKKYRDKLIIMSKSLVMINQKEVTQSTRQFLQNWYANKEAKKQEKLQAKERAESFDYIEGDFERDRLHSNYPYSLSNVYQDQEEVLSMSRLPNSKHLVKHHKQFVEVLAKAKEQRRLKTLPPLEQVEPRYTTSENDLLPQEQNPYSENPIK